MFKLSAASWQELPRTSQHEVPEDWIDSMGHMNVMWYTHLFSHGIMGFYRSIGLDRDYFQANQTGSFVLEQHVRYLAEIRQGESVSLRVRALGRSERKFHVIGFLIKDESNVLAATSEGITAHIDMRVRRTSAIPQSIRSAFDSLLERHRALDWSAPVNGYMRVS